MSAWASGLAWPGAEAWGLLALFLAAVWLVAVPLSWALAALARGQMGPLAKLDALLLRACGLASTAAQGWKAYAAWLLAFNAIGIVVLFAMQMAQAALPLNPQGFGAPAWHTALNTAVSFVTNTNWQSYAGEQSMSHALQAGGLAVQNFLSAATGIAVAFALCRGLAARTAVRGLAAAAAPIGHFGVDVLRITVWLLLPLAFVLALAFASLGVPQSFEPFRELGAAAGGQVLPGTAGGQTLPVTAGGQTLPVGPIASQEAIKMLGTNGGGVLNANSAHPFENPSPLSNFIQMLAIFAIPAGLVLAFGRLVGDTRQAVAIAAAMTVVFTAAVALLLAAESAGNPHLAALGADTGAGNLEGKETRFGVAATALFAAATTAASCGAVNGMHASLMPLGGFTTLALMQLGEVIFGGVGAGLYGMLVFVALTVFLCGLLIGRTPEWLGKRIEPAEMKWVATAILVTPALVLVGTALAAATPAGRAGLSNPDAHGFSEMLYAFTSAANNNGSAFAGLTVNTPFYDLALAFAMFAGRFGVIVPVLALAGAFAARVPADGRRTGPDGLPTTLPTHGPLFTALLVATVLGVGLLTYVPALALGPLVEHLALPVR